MSTESSRTDKSVVTIIELRREEKQSTFPVKVVNCIRPRGSLSYSLEQRNGGLAHFKWWNIIGKFQIVLPLDIYMYKYTYDRYIVTTGDRSPGLEYDH